MAIAPQPFKYICNACKWSMTPAFFSDAMLRLNTCQRCGSSDISMIRLSESQAMMAKIAGIFVK